MGKKRTRAVDAQDPTVEKMEVDGESSDDDVSYLAIS
jgi:hypothetical protein